MEDTFSLGNVLLYGEFPSKGKENSLTGEMAELFKMCIRDRGYVV